MILKALKKRFFIPLLRNHYLADALRKDEFHLAAFGLLVVADGFQNGVEREVFRELRRQAETASRPVNRSATSGAHSPRATASFAAATMPMDTASPCL